MAFGTLSLMKSSGVVPRTCTSVTFASFRSCQLLNGLPSVVSTVRVSVVSGTVKSITLARSGVRVRPPMAMSTLPLTRNGTRSAEPTGCTTSSTPSMAASFAAISASKPATLFWSSYRPSGGRVGLMPTTSFFAAITSSRLRARAGALPSTTAAIAAMASRPPKTFILATLSLPVSDRPRRPGLHPHAYTAGAPSARPRPPRRCPPDRPSPRSPDISGY